MAVSHAPAARRARAVESFGLAKDAIGPVSAGMSLFAITRGQWSMIDAIQHVLASVKGPCDISMWTWTVAEYEVQCLDTLMRNGKIGKGTMIIDVAARAKNHEILADWRKAFGPKSVRQVVNHAKIATVQSACGLRLLLRGSMNLNANPRFEQFDLTEGGADFDLVRQIEAGLPILGDWCGKADARAASGVSGAWSETDLQKTIGGLKSWPI